MAGRHVARPGGPGRIGHAIVAHPFQTGALMTAAVVAALVVTTWGTADLVPAPAHSRPPAPSAAAGAAPVGALSVPDVVGFTEVRARDALRAHGFSVEFRSESGQPATGLNDAVVIRQSPGPGARAAKGTNVALTVAPAGSGGSTPPQDAGGSSAPGTVSAPAASGSIAPATGGGGSTGAARDAGGAGSAGTAGHGGAAPAPPVPAPVPAPVPQPPAAPPATPVPPPPGVLVPTPPLPSLPLPQLPLSPLGLVSDVLHRIV